MKRIIVFLIFVMMVPAFGAYRLVLKNGAVLELAKKPDLTGKLVTAETMKGEKIIFPARLVDLSATKTENRKKPGIVKSVVPGHRIVPGAVETKKRMPATERRKGKAPLVITNETIKKAPTKAESVGKDIRKVQEETNRSINNSAAAVEEEGNIGGVVDDNGHGENYWREKFEDNQDMQAGLLKDLKKMQLKMNAMASRRIQSDDEIEKRTLAGKIQKLQKRVDKANADLQTLKENKKKLLEEARTSGALPAWYRDYED